MNRLIDYSSRFRILKGGKISLVVSALLGSVTISFAAPSGGTVTSGSATISQSGKVTNIAQSTSKASINWQKFSVAVDETVNFNQPNVNSITLNRVVGNERSVIDGALNANGQVWILNSNGVLFGKNASINTAGLLATTKELSDTDFQAGKYNFKGDSKASVINLGEIDISDSGYATLLANTVSNEGTIKAVKGQVHLVGANEVTINLNGNSIVDLTVDKGVLDALVENKGAVYADGGEIYLTTNAVNELLKGVVNNTGVIEANSLDGVTGYVELFAHGGEAKISGTIEAKDGFVETSADKVKISDEFKVKANKWLIDPKDFTIASSGGDITGTTLSSNLENASVEIQSVNGASDGNGDIFVNDVVSWDAATKLTLNAENNIFINKSITATNGQLALHYGDSADYYINAKVNLSAGDNFFTKQTSDGSETTWKVITELGSEGSTTGTDLQGINRNLSGNYVLGADIDASATSSWNSNAGFKPIGTFFQGNFDGLGHTIDSLFIDRPSENVGLFNKMQGSIISNVGLINADITGSSYSGGLAGQMQSSAMVKNSYVTGSVSGGTNSFIGGLVGQLQSGTVNNSYSTATVNGQGYIGGLVGQSQADGTILNSYSSSTVTAIAGAKGGLVALDSGTVTNSWYDNEANTVPSMGDKDTYGKTKAEIVTALSNLDEWTTGSGGGASVEGYLVVTPLTLPELVTFYTPNGEILFAGGFGIEADPYEITNWTQLQNINNVNVLSESYYYSLLNDLSSSTSDYTNLASSTANSNAGWNPIGDGGSKFEGVFDGQNYTIADLKINRPNTDYIGLFGASVLSTSSILNLNLSDLTIKGQVGTGSVIGYLGDGSLSNITVSGQTIVNGNDEKTGGIIGDLGDGIVDNVSFTGTVVGSADKIGGIVGFNESGEISNASFTGIITALGTSSNVGGIVGETNSGSKITNSKSSATINGVSPNNIGGIVGKTNESSNIASSYFNGTITGKNNVGGIVGFANGNGWTNGIINSYSSGTLNGADSVGGIVGYADNTRVQNSYSASEVTGTSHIGGIFGNNHNSNTVVASFFDKEIATGMSDENDYGKTKAQLEQIATFDNAGWDIEIDYTLSNNTYPLLTFDSGRAIWKISPYFLTYTLSDVTSGYTYNGNETFLSHLWNTEDIFGLDYSSWEAGVDYEFVYNNAFTTSLTNAGIYEDISVEIINDDFRSASTGSQLGLFTINKAEATVTADSDTVTYNGQEQSVDTFTASGLVNGETIAVLDGVSVSGRGIDAGTYATTASGTDENYNLTFVDGSLVIIPLPSSSDPESNTDLIPNPESTPEPETEPEPEPETPVVVTPTPEADPVVQEQQNEIQKVITTIVNKEVVNIVPPKIQTTTTPNNVGQNVAVNFGIGGNQMLISQPIEGQATQRITLGEARQMQLENGVSGEEVRVPLSRSSMIELVNGGVSLPDGVEQEFYVAEEL